jgi:AcrR family transcriptional regulator
MPDMAEPLRSPRSDAVRNRGRVLAAAMRMFSELGPEAGFSEIAREAGVGVGTVYRHFPTRTALIEAAYENEVIALIDAVPELLERLSPRNALREWMELFGGYLGVKATLSASAAIPEGPAPPIFSASRDRLIAAIDSMLAAGAGSGTRLSAEEVLLTLGGIVLTTDARTQSRQRENMFDFVADTLWRVPPAA